MTFGVTSSVVTLHNKRLTIVQTGVSAPCMAQCSFLTVLQPLSLNFHLATSFPLSFFFVPPSHSFSSGVSVNSQDQHHSPWRALPSTTIFFKSSLGKALIYPASCSLTSDSYWAGEMVSYSKSVCSEICGNLTSLKSGIQYVNEYFMYNRPAKCVTNLHKFWEWFKTILVQLILEERGEYIKMH